MGLDFSLEADGCIGQTEPRLPYVSSSHRLPALDEMETAANSCKDERSEYTHRIDVIANSDISSRGGGLPSVEHPHPSFRRATTIRTGRIASCLPTQEYVPMIVRTHHDAKGERVGLETYLWRRG